jgi:hypothetical protein
MECSEECVGDELEMSWRSVSLWLWGFAAAAGMGSAFRHLTGGLRFLANVESLLNSKSYFNSDSNARRFTPHVDVPVSAE